MTQKPFQGSVPLDSDDDAPELFLDRALQVLDWNALSPWIGAIESRLGMPVSLALFKMTLLERWFQLSSPELDDACHGRPAFRRFLAAPLHGPVAEVWMFRQFRPKIAAAEDEIGRLVTAVELLLKDRGLAPPSCSWTGTETAAVTRPSEGIRTTVFEPGRLRSLAADADLATAFIRPHGEGEAALHAATLQSAAILLWPWRATTALDRVLHIGRDPEFSPFARQLWADVRISRRHAELTPGPDGIVLRDLGSANGTFLGDARVEPGSSVILRADARLRFGSGLAVKLVFFPAVPPAPA